MFKHLGLAIAFSTVLVTVSGKTAWSGSPNFAYPATSDDGAVCYMQTTDGRMFDLSRICGRVNPAQQNGANADGANADGVSADTAGAVAPTPIRSAGMGGRLIPAPVSSSNTEGNLGGLRRSAESSRPCFALDAQGRPCPAVQ